MASSARSEAELVSRGLGVACARAPRGGVGRPREHGEGGARALGLVPRRVREQ